jgi:hypothetical protein
MMRTNVAVRALAPVLCWVPITCMWELVVEPRDLRDGHWNEVIRVLFLESQSYSPSSEYCFKHLPSLRSSLERSIVSFSGLPSVS